MPRLRRAGFKKSTALLVPAGYLALAVALYGHAVIGSLAHSVVGSGQEPQFAGRDQSFFVWSLAWVAHSVGQLQNPFVTKELFTPFGYDLAWAASIPGPAFALTPLTALAGPVVSYNLLILSAPPLAAWTMYLLCRELTPGVMSAIAGGLIFGFGSYETVEMINHVNLALVWLIPLAPLLVLRRRRRAISRRSFVILLGVLLAAQLWTSSEVFASLVLFGGVAFIVGFALAADVERRRIVTLARDSLLSLCVGLILALPFLYYVLAYPDPVPGISSAGTGTDVANLILPTRATLLHGGGAIAAQAASLRENLSEQLSYFGIPLIGVLIWFSFGSRRRRLARCVMVFAAISLIASLGGNLASDGDNTSVPLPWKIFSGLPFLRYAQPNRFVVYTWLAAAIAVSLFLAMPGRTRLRWVLFVAIALTLAPNFSGFSWGTRVDNPPLMTHPALLDRYVSPNANVLAVQYGIGGNSMFWQAEAGFHFRLAGGYASAVRPTVYGAWQAGIRGVEGDAAAHPTLAEFCRFLLGSKTQVILARISSYHPWTHLLSLLHRPVADAGGFWIYEDAAAVCPAVMRSAVLRRLH